ncbi:MAG: pseudouridine synthase, partial [Hyphomicrobiaceae bacterium]
MAKDTRRGPTGGSRGGSRSGRDGHGRGGRGTSASSGWTGGARTGAGSRARTDGANDRKPEARGGGEASGGDRPFRKRAFRPRDGQAGPDDARNEGRARPAHARAGARDGDATREAAERAPRARTFGKRFGDEKPRGGDRAPRADSSGRADQTGQRHAPRRDAERDDGRPRRRFGQRAEAREGEDRPGRPREATPQPRGAATPQRTGKAEAVRLPDASPLPTQPTASPTAAQSDGQLRIAKLISRAGLCSRRDAERWIAEGRVKLNGSVVSEPGTLVATTDQVLVDGEPLPEAGEIRLWRYHKPKGLVTTHSDPEGRETVFEALPPDLPRVISVGRLDTNTEGLLLLTTSGPLARHLELPATGLLRRYRVRAFGMVDQDRLDALADGIEIDGVRYGPIEATLDSVQGANVWLTIGLREGKNREVRRILESLDLTVNRLIRVSYGPFQLLDLEPGAVEVVRRRVLIDQLGPQVARTLGLGDDSEATAVGDGARGASRPAPRPGHEPLVRSMARVRDRPAGPPRARSDEGRPLRPRPAPKQGEGGREDRGPSAGRRTGPTPPRARWEPAADTIDEPFADGERRGKRTERDGGRGAGAARRPGGYHRSMDDRRSTPHRNNRDGERDDDNRSGEKRSGARGRPRVEDPNARPPVRSGER